MHVRFDAADQGSSGLPCTQVLPHAPHRSTTPVLSCGPRLPYAPVLSALIAALLLAGCGGGGGGDETAAAPTPPGTLPPVTLPVVPSVVAEDPLARYQWHLLNTGQDALSSTRPVAGVDLNLGTLYDSGVRGTGVSVAVLDTGLDIRHEDLQANVAIGGSINFRNGSGDPTSASTGGDHGTSVAGVVAARAWNGLGGRGVAPEAVLHGFNFLVAPTLANELASFGGAAQAAPVQVFNLSYGEDLAEVGVVSADELAAREQVMASSRAGRGGIYVKSAGNGFFSIDGVDCSVAQRLGVSCGNTNLETSSNLVSMTIVGSVNAAGRRASYSSQGASLAVMGLGGEFGENRAQAPGQADVAYQPALLTTDYSGCDKGYHRTIGTPANPLDLVGPSPLDPSCNYTAIFNGTSAAAPTVAGVAALMLQVNPQLSQREVQYLLATTARRVDYPGTPVQFQGVAVYDGWVVNGARRAFSNSYGFGLVDAQAAVAAARSFTPLAPRRQIDWQTAAPATPVPIPFRDGAGTAGSLPISVGASLTVESVQVAFNTTHRRPANLRVALISPSGTRSILVWPFSGIRPLTGSTTAGFGSDRMLTNAFLDENAQGTWRLEVVDVTAASGTSPSQLVSWSLRVTGR